MADDRDARIAELEAELRHCRERTELAETENVFRRQQEAATGEILRAIAAGPTDAAAVLQSIVENAATLTRADHAYILRADATGLRAAASSRLGDRPGSGGA